MTQPHSSHYTLFCRRSGFAKHRSGEFASAFEVFCADFLLLLCGVQVFYPTLSCCKFQLQVQHFSFSYFLLDLINSVCV